MMIESYQCTRCREVKPANAFSKKSPKTPGARPVQFWCKDCRSEHYKNRWSTDPEFRKIRSEKLKKHRSENPEWYRNYHRKYELAKKYGMTFDDYNQMLTNQSELCAICRNGTKQKTLDTDHDHKCGKVRGLLCNNCNRGIGHFQDNPDLLNYAAEYLRNHIC